MAHQGIAYDSMTAVLQVSKSFRHAPSLRSRLRTPCRVPSSAGCCAAA
jgi:hypothetical protein